MTSAIYRSTNPELSEILKAKIKGHRAAIKKLNEAWATQTPKIKRQITRRIRVIETMIEACRAELPTEYIDEGAAIEFILSRYADDQADYEKNLAEWAERAARDPMDAIKWGEGIVKAQALQKVRDEELWHIDQAFETEGRTMRALVDAIETARSKRLERLLSSAGGSLASSHLYRAVDSAEIDAWGDSLRGLGSGTYTYAKNLLEQMDAEREELIEASALFVLESAVA